MRRDLTIRLAWAALIASAVLSGCAASDRKIPLGAKEITTKTPIQLPRDTLPLAASSDGSRIAVWFGDSRLTVWTTEPPLKLCGTVRSNKDPGFVAFSRDAKLVYYQAEDGYCAWDYAAGRTTRIAAEGPSANGLDVGWNFDRSVAFDYGKRGQVVVPGLPPVTVPSSDRAAGFDQYGAAWFGAPHHWTRVDRAGRETFCAKRPHYLVQDQSKTRGSMRLDVTSTVSRHDRAKAYLDCVWLVDDKAIPYKGNGRRTRAAVLFAGADIRYCAFVPGQNMAFVYSDFGSYLIPFAIAAPDDKST